MCEIYTTHPGKCPGKCPGKPITGGHGAFTLHSLLHSRRRWSREDGEAVMDEDVDILAVEIMNLLISLHPPPTPSSCVLSQIYLNLRIFNIIKTRHCTE